MISAPLIALKSAGFSYDGVHWVLKGISLEVSKGERVAVLGHNGSGKSTLVKILGALQLPSQGACFVCGFDTSEPASLAEIRKRVSLVFQNPESQIVAAVVEDDVAFAPENQGLAPDEIEKKVAWALEKVGLLHKRGTLSSALSGGEKQRLALAGALAADAECLILDEPTSMLDPEGRAEVENVLRDIHASGTAIVQVSHRLDDVIQAGRVLVLSHGSWVWQGSGEDFLRDAKSLGFRLPPMMELRCRLFVRGETVEDVAEAVSKELPPPCGRLPPGRGPEEEGGAALSFDIRDLSHSFGLGTPVETRTLKNISCVVPKGRWTSVLGRTGSGKSTLIQHLNGLYGVQSGEIFVEGGNGGELIPIPAKGEALRNLRRRAGLVFQSPEDQLFSPTVREELAFAPMNWGFSKEDTDASVESALQSVGLRKEYLDRNPLRLSGGERRLAAIASVLSANPECLILDEPTAGLDAKFREDIVTLLSRLRDTGRTIITVTHDFEMAFEQSDHLIVMDKGRKVCEGGVGGVLPALLETEALMLPEVVRVSALLRSRGFNVPLTWRAEEIL
ncbi:MAG: energy-coupling factor transporter ATPase [Synergistaceae bacterium]|nr:energy-coupling factor transporter ATPase [Synergistaceae bacterium]